MAIEEQRLRLERQTDALVEAIKVIHRRARWADLDVVEAAYNELELVGEIVGDVKEMIEHR